MTIERQPVTSSWVRSVGYEASTSILEVEFAHGAIYRYFGVPIAVYEEFMASSSKGWYINNCIRGRGYRHQRVN